MHLPQVSSLEYSTDIFSHFILEFFNSCIPLDRIDYIHLNGLDLKITNVFKCQKKKREREREKEWDVTEGHKLC